MRGPARGGAAGGAACSGTARGGAAGGCGARGCRGRLRCRRQRCQPAALHARENPGARLASLATQEITRLQHTLPV